MREKWLRTPPTASAQSVASTPLRYDKHKVTPAFPFGFGLSYGGGFTYSGLRTSGRTISFTITRKDGGASAAAGCDTPQVYLSYPNSKEPSEPAKVLRYFQKTCEASTVISYTLSDRDVSTWDVQAKAWVVSKGVFGVTVAQAAQGGEQLTGSITI